MATPREQLAQFAEGSKALATLCREYGKRTPTLHLRELVGGALSFYAAAAVSKCGGVHVFVAEEWHQPLQKAHGALAVRQFFLHRQFHLRGFGTEQLLLSFFKDFHFDVLAGGAELLESRFDGFFYRLSRKNIFHTLTSLIFNGDPSFYFFLFFSASRFSRSMSHAGLRLRSSTMRASSFFLNTCPMMRLESSVTHSEMMLEIVM